MKASVLFAGAGGSSRGLEDAGCEVVGYEYWLPAVTTHQANGMMCHVHDLADEMLDARIAPCDLLWASPPCQPFSAAGDGEGEFDDRDGFPWTLRIIRRLRPAVVIIENVKGVTFAKHEVYFQSILTALRSFGYDVQWRVLCAADYGVPQTRERCFIIARRDRGPIVWPTVTHTEQPGMFTERWVSMADALGWGATERPFHVIATRMDGAGGSGARRLMEAERDAGRWVVGIGKLMGAGMVERHGERPLRTPDEPAFTIRAQGGNRDLGGVVWMLDRRASEDAGALLVDPHTSPAPTVTTVTTVKGHHEPGEQSQNAIRLTIPELARLQDFPDDWQWLGTKTDQAKMIGNAVPARMARLLGEVNRPC